MGGAEDRRRGGARPGGRDGARELVALPALLLVLALAACMGAVPPVPAPGSSPTTRPASAQATTPSALPSTPVASPAATKPVRSSASPSASAKRAPNLAGDRRNQWAFVLLDHPSEVTVEGRVSEDPGVVDVQGAGGRGLPRHRGGGRSEPAEPAEPAADRGGAHPVRRRPGRRGPRADPGRPGPAMTRVLRSIGDQQTTAPDQSQGLMSWSAREQVRFLAALANGQVVSKAASAYLLGVMHPVRAHAWGLGAIGASSFKGGWLRADTVTRQMGLVDGYAVAVDPWRRARCRAVGRRLRPRPADQPARRSAARPARGRAARPLRTTPAHLPAPAPPAGASAPRRVKLGGPTEMHRVSS